MVSLFWSRNIITVDINSGVHFLKSAKCLCLLSVVLVLVLLLWSWSCKQRSWSWYCYFGLGFGLKNFVLFTSLVFIADIVFCANFGGRV